MRIEDTGLPVELVENDLVIALETHKAIAAAINRLLEQVRAAEPTATESLGASPKKVLIVA